MKSEMCCGGFLGGFVVWFVFFLLGFFGLFGFYSFSYMALLPSSAHRLVFLVILTT